MTGRARGRSGRGWDAAPPRSARTAADPPRGNADPPRGHAGWARGDGGSTREPLDPAEKAREICLRLLAVRPRTRLELATALKRRGIDEQVAEEVLARYGANAWVSSRHHGRGLARRALANELRQKGIDTAIVGEALDELDPETETATARALVERKLRHERLPGTRGETDALLRRLVGMLARTGYSPGLAVRVVREAITERAEAAGTDAPALEVDALEVEALEVEALEVEALEPDA
jgi:regulatory protein